MMIAFKVLSDISYHSIEDTIKNTAKRYILERDVDVRLREVEDYLYDYYKFDFDIKELILEILDNVKVNKINNELYLTLPKVVSINDISLDSLEKTITYGNKSIRGSNIIRDAISYALGTL